MGRPWCCSVLVLTLLMNAWPSDGEALVRTLSVSSHLSPPHRNEPILVTHDDEPLVESVQQPRVRRDTAGVDNSKIKPTTLEVYALNDTRQQLMVHWAGENSRVIICLAKDRVISSAPDGGAKSLRPSTVYISYDYGSTYINKTDHFKLQDSQNSSFANLDKFYNHNKFSSHFIFTDSKNKVIFTTNDYGKTVKRQNVEFEISELVFHEEEPETIIVLDENSGERKLWLSSNFGRTWSMVQEFVHSFKWRVVQGETPALYLLRQEPTGLFTVLTSRSLFRIKGDIEVVISGVSDFQITENYMFASKKEGEKEGYQMLVSHNKKPFVPAIFPTQMSALKFHVCDVSNDQVMVTISHGVALSNLYVSDYLSNNSLFFSLSLPRIFAYFPNITWKDSLLKELTDEPFTDMYRVKGLKGIYIASQVKEGVSGMIGPEHLVTLISFDQGGEWRRISPPTFDEQGRRIDCNSSAECSLHLSQRFGQLYPSIRSPSLLSSASAPGLIIASGSVGKSLKSHAGVFMSHDAGLSWRKVFNELYAYNIGDHGGIAVAVKQNSITKEIKYSINEGESWQTLDIHKDDLKIYSLMTAPGENTTTFTMFGSLASRHQWLIVKIDLRSTFKRDCSDDDYKYWSPGSSDGPHMPCILGRKETYRRRTPHSMCYNGKDFDAPVKKEICDCDDEDFECDFGFFRNSEIKTCVRNKTFEFDPYAVPSICKPGKTYQRSKGYIKIPGDSCVDGDTLRYLPMTLPCPMKEQEEFLVVSEREKIGTISLSGKGEFRPIPVQGIKAVIGIEYDLKKNCLYYGDADQDFIGRLCLGDNSTGSEILVRTNLQSVEGMAYDWISNLLYFVDGARSTIEMIRTDIDHFGRMRRTVLDNSHLKKPRGIAVHPMQGHVFYTDWANGEPSISRCSPDGTNIKHLFAKPTIHWPNGITIDFIAERIYWVDAKFDYIGSSDLDGQKFRKILMNSKFIEHPFAIAVFKDNMYWTDWKKSSVYLADKDHGAGVTTLASDLPNLMDLKVFAHSIQEGTNACSNQTVCSHICVGMPQGKFKCLCPDALIQKGNECLCPSEEKPLVNGTCPSISNTCSPEYFKCKNNNCVPKSWRCDGDNDCSDGSDEENCEASSCQANHFQCKSNGKCIPAGWRCDFDNDCTDASDEEGCHYSSCSDNQFRCNNGRCISQKWVCDLEDDCRDGSDERNCSSTSPVTCGGTEFRCGGTTAQCIPTAWKCDGESDCIDGSDEKNCSVNSCEMWQFKCSNDVCIFKSWLCDGDKDCLDGSDEVNCTSTTKTTTPLPIPMGKCGPWQFSCKNQHCIPEWWKCDSVNDCGDNSDEIDCSSRFPSPTTPAPTPAPTPSDNCQVNQFRCFDKQCIEESWVCDGVRDCVQGEDEEHCGATHTCRPDQFTCRLDGACVNMTLICNGKRDCSDGSDEMGCDSTPDKFPDNTHCGPGFLSCGAGSLCLPLIKVCDGHMDCYDGQDESPVMCSENRVYQVVQMGVDERSIERDNLLLYWWIPKPADKKLEFLPSYSEAFEGATWTNFSKWLDSNTFKTTVEGLKPYQMYNLTVYVRVEGTKTAFPPAKYVTARTAEGVPNPPWNISLNQKSAREVEVRWEAPLKPNGVLVNYILYMSPPFPPVEMVLSAKLNMYSVKVEFEVGKNYSFWMKSRNGLLTSQISSIAFLRIDGDSFVGGIENLKVTAISNDSVSLSWDTVQGFEGYSITPKGKSSYSVLDPRFSSQSSTTVTHLAPGAFYTFQVSGYRKGFDGRAAQVTATTKGDELPTVPNISAEVVKSQGTTVKVNWDAPRDSRKVKWVYGIYYAPNMRELTKRPVGTTTDLTISIRQLEACESFIFDVGIVGPLGAGPMSGRMVNLRTQYSPFAAPKKVKIVKDPSRPTFFKLLWSASCDTMDSEIGYRIYFEEVTMKTHTATQLAASSNTTFSMEFNGTYGAEYKIQISTTADNALKSGLVEHSIPIPSPHQLQVLPQVNGSLVIYWENREIPEEVKSKDYHYEVLVNIGNWQGAEKARKFEAIASPFLLNETESASVYSVAVRLVTVSGYHSLPSEILTMETSEATWAEMITPTHVVWIVVPVVLIIVGLATALGIYVYRHQRLQHSFVSFANSHYDTRSGAATFTGGEGLDEDDAPVITGFSDDEPLVIA